MSGTFSEEGARLSSILADVRPLIETMPLEKAGEAYSRMRSGEARFRMVLTMKGAR